ncbi:MAG TPA: hypothetical protein VK629_11050 [Steroidobacteraceae bacterium]|nr:hypothetical protein [Steroidobacteraceae bacterium]
MTIAQLKVAAGAGIAAAMVCVGVATAQMPSATPNKSWKAPRTNDGTPDLQGVWTSATLTTLERPREYGTRVVMTDAEVRKIEGTEADYVANAAKQGDPNRRETAGECTNFQFGCGYNNFWIDRGSKVVRVNGEARASLIVDPPDGRLPALLPARQQQLAAQRRGRGRFDGPETLTLAERCLLSFGSSSGPPMLPVLYNNHYQIVQTKDTIMIQVEMVHDARIVRMNGKHGPKNVRKWMGDSVGRWEGDTLVVTTTNFNEQQSFRGSTPEMIVTERFTRVGPDSIVYKFNVEDPATFAKPFTGEMPFYLTNDAIFEYACHEGNYALPGILAGGREDERKAEENKAKGLPPPPRPARPTERDEE